MHIFHYIFLCYKSTYIFIPKNKYILFKHIYLIVISINNYIYTIIYTYIPNDQVQALIIRYII